MKSKTALVAPPTGLTSFRLIALSGPYWAIFLCMCFCIPYSKADRAVSSYLTASTDAPLTQDQSAQERLIQDQPSQDRRTQSTKAIQDTKPIKSIKPKQQPDETLNRKNLLFSDAQIKTLSKHQTWLDLLHYHDWHYGRRLSEIDDPSFFVSPEGKYSPTKELKTYIEGLSKPNTTLHCKFPARFHWIRSQLKAFRKLSLSECKTFSAWKEGLDLGDVYMVFPVAYLNSPSSMFGHTLLRVKKASTENALLDTSISYAASHNEQDNNFVFAYKGLTGGYPGILSIKPYHEKVKEYSYLEARDIWEYKLRLSQAEKETLVRHLWEIKDANTDYFFSDENCAYRLLTVLDAAIDDVHLSSSFQKNFLGTTIPADTIKILYAHDRILESTFRPSQVTKLQTLRNKLEHSEILTAQAIVLDSRPGMDLSLLEPYNTDQQFTILRYAYGYARYLKARRTEQSDTLNVRALQILQKISNFPNTVDDHVPPPSSTPEQGHDSSRITFGLRNTYKDDNKNNSKKINTEKQALLSYRLAYHDFIDPISGYPAASELEMLNTTVSVDDQTVRLDSLDIINIASYNSSDETFTNSAWEVSLGLKRDITTNEKLAFSGASGLGKALLLGQTTAYGLGTTQLYLNDKLQNHHQLNAGVKLGLLLQDQQMSLHTQGSWDYSTRKEQRWRLDVVSGIQLHQSTQLRMSGSINLFKRNGNSQKNNVLEFSVATYF